MELKEARNRQRWCSKNWFRFIYMEL